MGKYSLELRECLQSGNIFTFDYDFYDENHKVKFEEKFIEHYYFNEIGQPTLAKFKQRLRARLNKIAPYYEQLYNTELESLNINFLLNKDLVETFEHEKDKQVHENGSSSVSSTAGSKSDNNITGGENNKESSVNDGISSPSFEEGNLTSVSKNSYGSETSTSTSENSKGSSSSKSENVEIETFKTRLVSQGNIGTTSSAELLEKWRSVLINIDEQIIEECEDLFMLIY